MKRDLDDCYKYCYNYLLAFFVRFNASSSVHKEEVMIRILSFQSFTPLHAFTPRILNHSIRFKLLNICKETELTRTVLTGISIPDKIIEITTLKIHSIFIKF